MSLLRHWAGLTRDGFRPGSTAAERRTGRRQLVNEISQRLRPSAAGSGSRADRPENLYPAQWRLVEHRPTSRTAVVWLRSGDPLSLLTALAMENLQVDCVVCGAGAAGASGAFVAPRHWSSAQRLLALANSGVLDHYDELVVVDQVLPSAAEAAAAVASLGHPSVGVVAPLVRHTVAVQKWVRDRLAALRWSIDVADTPQPAGVDLICRAFLIQGLRSLRLTPEELTGDDSAARLSCLIGALAAEAGSAVFDTAEGAPNRGQSAVQPRIVAFYLPQFHPTPQNDRWWGRGFTEWTNVAAARPSYQGHVQPKLPADLGFYDLRMDTIREKQDSLAADAGMTGFMYYDYWFQGEKVLGGPLEALDKQTGLTQQHCLMWANENWTRTWYSDPETVLVEQRHDKVSPTEYLRQALPFMRNQRYLEVNQAKVLAVYRPNTIPDFPTVVAEWRRVAAAQGIDLYLLAVESDPTSADALTVVDGTMAFPPHLKVHELLSSAHLSVDHRFRGKLYSYRALVEADEHHLSELDDHAFPGVMTGWDNTARRQDTAHIWTGANPYTFRRWLLAAAEAVALRPVQQRLVFVNAWNEWAEGAVLEPSVEFGSSYLCAVRDVARS